MNPHTKGKVTPQKLLGKSTKNFESAEEYAAHVAAGRASEDD